MCRRETPMFMCVYSFCVTCASRKTILIAQKPYASYCSTQRVREFWFLSISPCWTVSRRSLFRHAIAWSIKGLFESQFVKMERSFASTRLASLPFAFTSSPSEEGEKACLTISLRSNKFESKLESSNSFSISGNRASEVR